VNYGSQIPQMQLGNTTPEHIKRNKKTKAKNSCDAFGVSTKMLKNASNEIAVRLVHIRI